ncbi:sulfatase-like hydrolase/transferase [Aureliella helgolandensis]|uniref:Sulfatase n=1 Tax=Aureliella helgolandensis TaxID=2527968 RepID=A0A518G0C5_9BACT|nr:sulfatase-like hydrolase/transferase [Aureliella helgolandensis]QDV22058.1 Sulfatase [Aureliella helgolandensis]
MHSSIVHACVLLATAGIVLLDSLGSRLQAAERPNVVWLISEDNSAEYLRLYDAHGAEAPRIAQLASDGLLFKNAYSNAPVCSVARTTLMTGCYGPRIGTQFHRREFEAPMPPGVEMFPAYLRAAGYYTTNNSKKDYNATETRGTWDESSKSANWRGRRAGQSFFHMQSFGATHESSLHFSQQDFERQKTIHDPTTVSIAPYHPDTELFRFTVAKYLDNIQTVDQQIGAVVDQLDQDELLEDTFIFYFGDHGGVLPRGKGYAYNNGLHVPLVVRIPENFKHLSPWPADSQVPGFVQFIDMGATTLNLAGVPVPTGIDGQPFLGLGVTASAVDARDEAFGYADRFDEKYDFVRSLRVGKYDYIRSYQPFNFDGLQNNYRYIMLAYRQWREQFQAGKLNETQSQFFRTRPSEMLFDVEADPHEVHNLANDPAYATVLQRMRDRLQSKVKSLPDLSFYPESYLAEHAAANPTQFGTQHASEIAEYVAIADLSLAKFRDIESDLERALASRDPIARYWAIIACSSHGKSAASLAPIAQQLAQNDDNRLVRVRAAEFLGLIGVSDPQSVLLECLGQSKSPIEANLILNTVVLLRDGEPGYDFDISARNLLPQALESQEVQRRLAYLEAVDGIPKNPQARPQRVPKSAQ